MTTPKTLRADLHGHTHYSWDSIISPEAYVRACLRRGINCVAVTDHNTIVGALAVQKIAPFKVIVGEEIRTNAGEIIGLFLTETIPGGLSPEETIERIKAQGGLVLLPHPFGGWRSFDATRLDGIASSIDAIEAFNARVLSRRDNDLAQAFANKHNLAMSAGSDAHSPCELGHAYIEISDFDGPQEFLAALHPGRIVGRLSSPLVHAISTLAKLRRCCGWQPS